MSTVAPAARFVIWDLDGTLLDSASDIVRHANAVRTEFGLPTLPLETIRGYVGEGARRLIDQTIGLLAPARLRERALASYLARYEAEPMIEAKAFEGIDALVRSLSGRQAIATNKPGTIARRISELLGWSAHIPIVVGAGEVPRKPAPDIVHLILERAGVKVKDAVFVGDSVIDVETAKAAGIDMVAVSWGLRPRHELAGAPVIVDDAAALREILFR